MTPVCAQRQVRAILPYTPAMALPESLQIALKEWDTVCAALASGRQMVLLRKGGIFDDGGEFRLENPQFLLFPTYLHQTPRMLKPEAHGGYQSLSAEPMQVKLAAAGEVTDIVRIAGRAQIDAIDAEHIWTPPLIDMRFAYRPENPLYLMLVRAYRLAQPVTIDNTPAYAGCKSWVPLDAAICTSGVAPVLDDGEYQGRRESILSRIRAG